MPIYEYECPFCHDRREVYRSIAERDEPVHCDHCVIGAEHPAFMERKTTAPASTFPGAAGWRSGR
jgi:putative FmdB family regulatory protein